MDQRGPSPLSISSLGLSTPNTTPESSPVAEQSWQTLIDNLIAFIDSRPRPYPHHKMEKPFVPSEYTSRDSPLEVCAIELCHAYPEFMVVGTYALAGQDDRREHEVQIRKGTLSIMTVAAKFQATYTGMLPPALDQHEFPSAILDLRFHPDDDTLLGVATSAASIHFFRLVKEASILDRRVEMKLVPLGWAKIADDDEHGLTHLLTQFVWAPGIGNCGKEGVDDQLIVTLAATESSGRVQLVKLAVPAIQNSFDKRVETDGRPTQLTFGQVYLHTHSEEAWTVSTFDIPSPQGTNNRFLLSGGDDSALRTSLLNLDAILPSGNLQEDLEILASPPIPGWTDQKSYNGGVTAILPLPPTLIASSSSSGHSETTIPLLTGSYDDTIRLYLLHPSTLLRRQILDKRLGGGVWRLKLMDEYELDSAHHYIILVSCMHAGVRILRVCYCDTTATTAVDSTSSSDSSIGNATKTPEGEGWSIEVIALFEKGHESMVYSCDFRREDSDNETNTEAESARRTKPSGGGGAYTIVSTSFYDKKICTWRFVDSLKARLNEETRKSLSEKGSWEEVIDAVGGETQIMGTMGTPTVSAAKSARTPSGWVKEKGEWRVR